MLLTRGSSSIWTQRKTTSSCGSSQRRGTTIPLKTDSGEERAWTALRSLDPAEVCLRAEVAHDPASCYYTVSSFGMDIFVSPADKTITGSSAEAESFISRLRDLFVPAVLVYLAEATGIPLTGRQIRPVDVKGGHLFSGGTHVLPLDRIAEKFGRDREAFLQKGMALGGQPGIGGDAAVTLFPLPKIPVTMLLWLEDDEFPARADLLFDSSCSHQVPVDVLWAAAMVSVLVME